MSDQPSIPDCTYTRITRREMSALVAAIFTCGRKNTHGVFDEIWQIKGFVRVLKVEDKEFVHRMDGIEFNGRKIVDAYLAANVNWDYFLTLTTEDAEHVIFLVEGL